MVVVTNAVVVSATTKSLKDGSVRALRVWALPYFKITLSLKQCIL